MEQSDLRPLSNILSVTSRHSNKGENMHQFNIRGDSIRYSSLLVVMACSMLILSCGEAPHQRASKVAPEVTTGRHDTSISKQTKADVLDATRVLVKRELGIDVKFVVQNLQKGNDWVLFMARPVNPDGSAVDYTKTKYYQNDKERFEDAFDDQVVALLHLKDGRWEVVEFSIGATDYSGQGWLEDRKIADYFK